MEILVPFVILVITAVIWWYGKMVERERRQRYNSRIRQLPEAQWQPPPHVTPVEAEPAITEYDEESWVDIDDMDDYGHWFEVPITEGDQELLSGHRYESTRQRIARDLTLDQTLEALDAQPQPADDTA